MEMPITQKRSKSIGQMRVPYFMVDNYLYFVINCVIFVTEETKNGCIFSELGHWGEFNIGYLICGILKYPSSTSADIRRYL